MAHNCPITCLKMNLENTFLFTSCSNGIVGFFSVISDKLKGKDLALPSNSYAEEILIEKE